MPSEDSKLLMDSTPQSSGQNCMADRISSLPDEILLHILRFSLLRDAVATGLLSSRWRNLWKSLKTFKFDPLNKLGVYKRDIITTEREVKQSRMRSYAEWVDGVLHQLQHLPNVHEFWICSDFSDEGAPYLDECLSFASNRNVRILNINLKDDDGYCTQWKPCNFPSSHFTKDKASSLIHLHLTGVEVCFPGFNHFTSLATLTLSRLTLTDEMAQTALSSCLLLEHLYIRLAEKLVNLKVVGSSLRLKHLELYLCHHLETVEIDAPNLESLKYNGTKTSFAFKNVPKLVKVRFGSRDQSHRHRGRIINRTSYAFSQLDTICTQLESLLLETNTLQIKEMSPLLCPTFMSLKALVLFVYANCDSIKCIGLPWFLEACPILGKFELHIYGRKSDIELESGDLSKAPISPHRYLKEIEVSGFLGRSYDTELLKYLVMTAVSLEKLRIVTYEKFLQYASDEVLPCNRINVPNARQRATQLCRGLLTKAEVLVL